MIRNNLAILMAQRGVKNSTLSAKTGISKNTISATSSNDGKMIQLETINKICQVLGVTPCDFFSYLPYDISIKVVPDEVILKSEIVGHDEIGLPVYNLFVSGLTFNVLMTKALNNSSENYLLQGRLDKPANIDQNDVPDFVIDYDEEYKTFLELWKTIPTEFQTDIEAALKNEVIKELGTAIENEAIEFSQNNFSTLNEVNYFLQSSFEELSIMFLPF